MTINWGDGAANNTKISLPKGRKYFDASHPYATTVVNSTMAYKDFALNAQICDYTRIAPAYTALYAVNSTYTFRVWNYLRRPDHEIQSPATSLWLGNRLL